MKRYARLWLCGAGILMLCLSTVHAKELKTAKVPASMPTSSTASTDDYAAMAIEANLSLEQQTKLKEILTENAVAREAWEKANGGKIQLMEKQLKEARESGHDKRAKDVQEQLSLLETEHQQIQAPRQTAPLDSLAQEQKLPWVAHTLGEDMVRHFKNASPTSAQAAKIWLMASERSSQIVDNPKQAALIRMRLIRAIGREIFMDNRGNHERLVAMIGPQAVVSPQVRERLLNSSGPLYIYEDVDHDGDPDIVTFIDHDQKHTPSRLPMLVRVIDDDDDMTEKSGPDQDSDCYVADWNADGIIDRVVDYIDEDHDGDADRMDLYYLVGWHSQTPGLVISRDVSDDNKMWATRDYEYDQAATQWLSDFNGDESFCMYSYDKNRKMFATVFENPFTHHDLDGDGLAELTVRFSGSNGVFQIGRYSMDVDNDSHWLNRRDYDFSLTPTGPAIPPSGVTWQEVLRDGSLTEASIPWDRSREGFEGMAWKRTLLAWDEIDHNVDFDRDRKRWNDEERWEGVGGYRGSISSNDLGESNKRWEEDADFSGRMQLYYSSADRRIHLLGAEKGQINFDYNCDGIVDATLAYADSDQDGYLDTTCFDANNDGKVDRTCRFDPRPSMVDRRYPGITDVYRSALKQSLDENQRLIDAMKTALREKAVSAAENWFINKRPSAFYDPDKLYWSDEAIRLYQDMTREELYTILLRCIDANEFSIDRRKLEAEYATGNYIKCGELIYAALGSQAPDAEPWYEAEGTHFTRRLRLRLNNPTSQDLPQSPVVISVEDIRRAAPDFNPNCFMVAETQKHILIRQHPSQADDLDCDGRPDEVVFVLNCLPKGGSQDCFIYYSPDSSWSGAYRQQTNALNHIGAGNLSIGLESAIIGFRSYYGKFDIFGKKNESLALAHLGKYHDAADWGMDILHVGSSPGCGGATVWQADKYYRAYNEANVTRCDIFKKIISAGPVRATIRQDISDLRVDGSVYSLTILSSVYANQLYCEHRVEVHPGAGNSFSPVISAGLMDIPRSHLFFKPEAGVLGCWGLQNPKIGELGLAIIADPAMIIDHKGLSDSNEVRLSPSGKGAARYFAAGEWSKSRTDQRRVVSTTAQEWEKQAVRLAERVLHPVTVRMGALEKR